MRLLTRRAERELVRRIARSFNFQKYLYYAGGFAAGACVCYLLLTYKGGTDVAGE